MGGQLRAEYESAPAVDAGTGDDRGADLSGHLQGTLSSFRPRDLEPLEQRER